MNLLLAIIIKVLAWIAFSFAAANLAVNTVAYIRKESDSTGTGAILRLIMIGAAFALWSIFK